ncbi:MAG TPA: DUF4157 domain-containing protein [Allosphingosinicella sp.]|nr:DUF4157 domain-containing protein [Allosphingosinicella sp.]
MLRHMAQRERRPVIGRTDDPAERDADRLAGEALAAHSGAEAGGGGWRAGSQGPDGVPAPASVDRVLAGSGAPLEPALRHDMERRFGEDFSAVRVHAGAAAARSAEEVRARAYTVGSDIVLAAGQSLRDRGLLAHELAHVAQGARSASPPVLRRQPKPGTADPPQKYPEWTPAAMVRALERLKGDDWKITIDGSTSAESAEARIWRHKFSTGPFIPTGVTTTLEVAITEPIERGWFIISGLKYYHLDFMEPSIARLFQERGMVDELNESPELTRARDAFRSHNDELGGWVHGAIHAALRRATTGNPDLMIAYYRYYSSHDLESEDMKGLGTTSSGDTEINTDLLNQEPTRHATSDRLSLLGGTLIHEFAHGPHGPKEHLVAGTPKEAKAYAIELFLAERMGDEGRANDIGKMWFKNDSVILSTGSDKIFNRTYWILSELYKIIDSRGGAEGAAARRMSVDFISRNEADYGAELKAFIAALER